MGDATVPSGENGRTPAISVVVAVYRRAEILELVLSSLLDQNFSDFEVVVADDGSGSEILDVIERYRPRFQHPIVHVWHEDQGFRKTIVVNRAVTRATAEYLVFIDGDCILHRRFLERHWKRRRPGQVLTGRRVMLDGELTSKLTVDDVRTRRIERPWFWLGHCGRNDCKHGFYAPVLSAVRNRLKQDFQVLGSNFSVYKGDFYRVNGYDERIVGRGLEDNNLCVRFINSGFAVKSVAFEAIQYHCFHASGAIPHSTEFIEEYRSSRETRTPFGIVKE
jgi:glycosyltransferase involved in cell wall biosynthesis